MWFAAEKCYLSLDGEAGWQLNNLAELLYIKAFMHFWRIPFLGTTVSNES